MFFFTDTLNGYAATLDGIIFRTVNGGHQWTTPLIRAARASSFRSIEFLDDKATGLCGMIDTGGAVFLTTDKGATWNNIGTAVGDTISLGRNTMCGISHSGDNFYATGAWFTRQARFYKSKDKGRTWSVSYLDTNLISSGIDIHFSSPDTGFITGGLMKTGRPTSCVILKTTDGGASWRRVLNIDTLGGRIWKLQAVTPTLLVGSVEPNYNETFVGMVRSTDGGESWEIVNTGFSRRSNGIARTIQGVGFRDSLHGWLGGYFNGMYETTDGGLTWSELQYGANLNRFFVLDSNHVYAGGDKIYFFGDRIPQAALAVPTLPPTAPHVIHPVRPNPTAGITRITFELRHDTHVLLEVMSVTGQRSWPVFNGWLGKGRHTCEWDGSAAQPGTYLIWLGTNEIPVTEKFSLLR